MTHLVKPGRGVEATTRPLFITARTFPASHGFTTRDGGVSEGGLASLNLGYGVGDAAERVDENLRRLCDAAGLPLEDVHTASQVHGVGVHIVSSSHVGRARLAPRPEADALVTSEPEAALAVRVADCLPILVADPVAKRVAAVHSGWRGTLAEVSRSAVLAMAERGSRASDLHFAIGPGIRSCCYEVSEELANRFAAAFGPPVIVRKGGAPHLDLVFAVGCTLQSCGVPKEQVEVLDACTSCSQQRYFSHRRDRGQTGRHLGFVSCRFL